MFVDLTQYMWILWLIFIFIFIIIELLTLEFTFLMIAVGSLAGLGVNLLGWEWWLQFVVAAVVSVLLILTIRPLLLRTMHKGADNTPTNIPALIGMRARVVKSVTADGGGQVKLANGETWTARIADSAPAAPLEEGTVVTVTAIEGATAVITPQEEESTT
ncbi:MULTISPECIES: NfeD family protein [unclassified Cryobacterium]|uniref:NfeD family protein n=1 Tax=unclassified Cryobacterium TaxID=2649013 RepID=UPI001446D2D0|nr:MULTISPECIES: NfeD family protein [unclassified Cryobacterium]